ncbi:MAG: 2-C-methyl-D-erythritol 4-phosphate cytidylyltransferase [Schwartzia sp.]|nr:2-C-methyl-D-erythritol 4-phosphate cytidylyltransferase [Schwartzia sp. (in: firmicutes)]
MVTVIFPAAGEGRRMNAGKNKVLLELLGKPILVRTLLRFSECSAVDDFIVVVGEEDVEMVTATLAKTGGLKPFRVVAGGSERQYSVRNGLAALHPDAEVVLVHDAARPLVSVKTIEAVVAEAWRSGAAIAAVRAKNTIKIVRGDGVVESTPERAKLWEVQTPQGFRRDILEEAYRRAEAEGFLGTDDAGLVERLGFPVRVVEGSYRNIKVTTPEDLWVVETFMQRDIVGSVKAKMESAGEDIDAALDGLDAFADKLAATVTEKIRAYRNKGEKQ